MISGVWAASIYSALMRLSTKKKLRLFRTEGHVVALNHAVEPLSLGTRLFLFRRNDISLSHESGSQPKFVKPLAGREAMVRLHSDFLVSMRFHIHRQTGRQLATPGQTSCADRETKPLPSRMPEPKNRAVIDELMLIGAFRSNGQHDCKAYLIERIGRHERTRTTDPYRVRAALGQLSYAPG